MVDKITRTYKPIEKRFTRQPLDSTIYRMAIEHYGDLFPDEREDGELLQEAMFDLEIGMPPFISRTRHRQQKPTHSDMAEALHAIGKLMVSKGVPTPKDATEWRRLTTEYEHELPEGANWNLSYWQRKTK